MFKTPGERLKHYRIEAKLNQRELASKLGIEPSSLSEIESGETRATLKLDDDRCV